MPVLSKVMPSIEGTGLWIIELDVLRLHDGETLRRWCDRFEARWDELRQLHDDRFKRMRREYCLITSEMSFRDLGFRVLQAR